MDLTQYWRAVRDRWRWVAFLTLAGVLIAMVLCLLTPQKYAATAQMFLATPGYSSVGSLSTDNTSPYQADRFSQNRAQTYVRLATQTELAGRAIQESGLDMNAADLARATEARIQPDTVLIDVTVRAESAVDAKVLADAVVAELAREIRTLETPSGSLIPTVDPIVTQTSSEPDRPSEPNVWIYLVLGLSLGFLVGVTAVSVAAGSARAREAG